MKKSLYLFLLFVINFVYSQSINTSKGIVYFEASVPLYEEVESANYAASCNLNVKTGEFKSSIIIKDFHFKKALMEQHFNDYYLESYRYPKATYKGRILDFDWSMVNAVSKQYKMIGILEMHGKKRKIETVAILRKVNSKLEIISNFSVKANDYNIKVPTVLRVKIAETVNIKTNFLLE